MDNKRNPDTDWDKNLGGILDGILLMAYGTPDGISDIERYYTEILKGKKPTALQLEKLKKRYMAIKGGSPLLEITRSQTEKLQEALKKNGINAKVYYGMKYSKPYINEAVDKAKADGISNLVCLPLAPFYTAIGTGSYFNQVSESAERAGFKGKLHFIKSWCDEQGLAEAWIEKVSKLGIDKGWVMLFTAHSMPTSDADDLSIYRRQLINTANSVEKHFGCKWSLCFQSKADAPGKWIGPDAAWQIKELSKAGIKRLCIIPIGFISNNLETMYDVGIELLSLCKELGIEARISEMPNDSEGIINALYSVSAKAIHPPEA
jgi:ferrochelatase